MPSRVNGPSVCPRRAGRQDGRTARRPSCARGNRSDPCCARPARLARTVGDRRGRGDGGRRTSSAASRAPWRPTRADRGRSSARPTAGPHTAWPAPASVPSFDGHDQANSQRMGIVHKSSVLWPPRRSARRALSRAPCPRTFSSSPAASRWPASRAPGLHQARRGVRAEQSGPGGKEGRSNCAPGGAIRARPCP
jgi:hypothetical protein